VARIRPQEIAVHPLIAVTVANELIADRRRVAARARRLKVRRPRLLAFRSARRAEGPAASPARVRTRSRAVSG
jgi:hypothetical protein